MPCSYNSFSVTPLQHLTMLNFVSSWWRGGTYWVLGLQDTSVSCFFSSLSDVRLCSDLISASRLASWIFPRDWVVTICYSLSSPSAFTQHCSYIYSFTHMFVVAVQSLSCVQVFVTPWTAASQASLSFTSPGACSNSCPLSQWCHPTISSFVVPFSSCFQSFPASGSFPMSRFFTSSGQNIGASASASVLPMNTQDWFPLGLTGLISLLSKGLSRVFSNTTVQKHQFFSTQPSL